MTEYFESNAIDRNSLISNHLQILFFLYLINYAGGEAVQIISIIVEKLGLIRQMADRYIREYRKLVVEENKDINRHYKALVEDEKFDTFSLSSLEKLDLSFKDLKDEREDESFKIFTKNINTSVKSFQEKEDITKQSLMFSPENLKVSQVMKLVFIDYLITQKYRSRQPEISPLKLKVPDIIFSITKKIEHDIFLAKDLETHIKLLIFTMITTREELSERLVEDILIAKCKKLDVQQLYDLIVFIDKMFKVDCSGSLEIDVCCLIQIKKYNEIYDELDQNYKENNANYLARKREEVLIRFQSKMNTITLMSKSSYNNGLKAHVISQVFRIVATIFYVQSDEKNTSEVVKNIGEIISHIKDLTNLSKYSHQLINIKQPEEDCDNGVIIDINLLKIYKEKKDELDNLLNNNKNLSYKCKVSYNLLQANSRKPIQKDK